MKTILEVPEELNSLKRRTIRSLATEAIGQDDCTYITTRLEQILERIESINKEEQA